MGKSGLDRFGGENKDKCALCNKYFDPADAKIWTSETGKVHVYPCYAEYMKWSQTRNEEVKKLE